MVGLSWSVSPQTAIYANASQSFDPPSTTELANPFGPTGFNPVLDAQTALNLEMGVKGAGERYRYELAVFHIDVDDAIVPFELEGSGQAFFENAGTSSHDGFEAGGSVEITRGLTLSGSYTYSDFVFDRFEGVDGVAYDGNRIPGIPRDLYQAGVRWEPRADLFMGFDLLHASHFYADNANQVQAGGYTVADVRIEYRRIGQRMTFAPFAGVNNISDENYADNIRLNAAFGRYYEPAPERNIYAGIEIRGLFSQ
jgi:iron complex outermembrane receptor protein